MFKQCIIAVGGIPDAKFSCHAGVHPALYQIVSRGFPLLLLQAVIKESSCSGVYVKQSLFCLLCRNDLSGFFRFRKGNMCSFRQFFHRFGKIHIFHFHQKGKHIPCRTASKAVINNQLDLVKLKEKKYRDKVKMGVKIMTKGKRIYLYTKEESE